MNVRETKVLHTSCMRAFMQIYVEVFVRIEIQRTSDLSRAVLFFIDTEN